MLGIVTGLAAEARIARRLSACVEAGGGDEAGASRAAGRLIDRGCAVLLSFGLAGGLDPGLRPGDLVIPGAVAMPDPQDARFVADPGLTRLLGGPTHAVLLGGGPMLATAADKRIALAATGAVAVDLESAAVARIAARHGLPFAVLRAVCDPAGRDLPAAALAALDTEGRIRPGRVLAAVLRRPGGIPGLIRLGQDAAAARRTLLGRVAALGPLRWPP